MNERFINLWRSKQVDETSTISIRKEKDYTKEKNIYIYTKGKTHSKGIEVLMKEEALNASVK